LNFAERVALMSENIVFPRRALSSIGRTVLLLVLVESLGSGIHAQEELATSATPTTDVQLIPVVFSGTGQSGDYAWMRNQPGYERAYFIFNDNEEQFLAHQRDPNGAEGCAAGGGNAAARPWQCESPPRSGGVPTGTNASGGFQVLTPQAKAVIDQAFTMIEANVRNYGFDKVVYSSCIKGGSPNCTLDDDLGTGIFRPSEDVRKYIIWKLKNISS
jgi:hypothetical protein